MASATVELGTEFRYMILRIADHLTSEEREKIVYAERLPPALKEQSNLSVLSRLEANGRYCPINPDGLHDILKGINRYDLLSQVKEYKDRAQKLEKERAKKLRKKRGGADHMVKTPAVYDPVKEAFTTTLTHVGLLMRQVEHLRRAVNARSAAESSDSAFHRENEEEAYRALAEAEETVQNVGRSLRKALSAIGLKSNNSSDENEGSESKHPPPAVSPAPRSRAQSLHAVELKGSDHESKYTSPAASPALRSKAQGSPATTRGQKPHSPLLPPTHKQKRRADEHKAVFPGPDHGHSTTSPSPLLQHLPKPDHTLGSHGHVEEEEERLYHNVTPSHAVQETHNDEPIHYVNTSHGREVLDMQEPKSLLLVRCDSYRQRSQSQSASDSPRVATRHRTSSLTGHGTPPLPTHTHHPRSENVLELASESNLGQPTSGTDGDMSDYTGGTGDSGYGGDLKDWKIRSPATLSFNPPDLKQQASSMGPAKKTVHTYAALLPHSMEDSQYQSPH